MKNIHNTVYRTGQVGALLDEYERAAQEFKRLVNRFPETEFLNIVDEKTSDEHCRSVQTIVSHVINSGYGYADYLRASFDIKSSRPVWKLLSKEEFLSQLELMIYYTSETLEGRWEMSDSEILKINIQSRWGNVYDLEQLLEHAIVHILRHRRQIEKFIAAGKLFPDNL